MTILKFIIFLMIKINILLCDNVFKKFKFILYFLKHNIISLDIIYKIIIYNNFM